MTTMTFVGPSFTLTVPTDWFAFSSPQYQTMFLSPPAADGQRANFTITIQPRENNITPEQYAKLLRQSYAQLGATREISEESTITLGEVLAHLTVATVLNGDEEPEIVQQEVIAVADDMLYVLLAARPANFDEALEDSLDAIFAMMLETFRFKQATLAT